MKIAKKKKIEKKKPTKTKTLKFSKKKKKKKQEIETIKKAQKMSNMIKNEERRGPNPEKVEARRASARREGGRRVEPGGVGA